VKKRALISDLDNTLCNATHRMHLHDAGKYEEFHSLCTKDPVNENVKRAIYAFCHQGFQPIFLTARPSRFRPQTIKWLNDCFGAYVPYFILHMKRDDDDRPDDVVKQNIYLQKIQPEYDVKLVLEDRDHVVKMFRSLGLETWQVANGNY
jgi:hypothetical protein